MIVVLPKGLPVAGCKCADCTRRAEMLDVLERLQIDNERQRQQIAAINQANATLQAESLAFADRMQKHVEELIDKYATERGRLLDRIRVLEART